MADTHSRRRARTPERLPLPDQVALVLQGGGALGAYQAGIVEGLEARRIEVDWVAGISIGAVNAAIVAGNPPEARVAQAARLLGGDDRRPARPALRRHASNGANGCTCSRPAWSPRRACPASSRRGCCRRPWRRPKSVGRTELLRQRPAGQRRSTNMSTGRCSTTGRCGCRSARSTSRPAIFRFFDTQGAKRDRIDARHIMASGALPPGLPPVEIDGAYWWDGGIVSNTPLAYVLDNQKARTCSSSRSTSSRRAARGRRRSWTSMRARRTSAIRAAPGRSPTS